MQPFSGVLKNVCPEGFRDTIFSSVTVEFLSDPYDSKALEEQLIEKTPPDGCLDNFFCRFIFFIQISNFVSCC